MLLLCWEDGLVFRLEVQVQGFGFTPGLRVLHIFWEGLGVKVDDLGQLPLLSHVIPVCFSGFAIRNTGEPAKQHTLDSECRDAGLGLAFSGRFMLRFEVV